MPNLDKMGPMGQGNQTGRKMGNCAGNVDPIQTVPYGRRDKDGNECGRGRGGESCGCRNGKQGHDKGTEGCCGNGRGQGRGHGRGHGNGCGCKNNKELIENNGKTA